MLSFPRTLPKICLRPAFWARTSGGPSACSRAAAGSTTLFTSKKSVSATSLNAHWLMDLPLNRPEQHILLFRRPLGTDPITGNVDAELEREAKEQLPLPRGSKVIFLSGFGLLSCLDPSRSFCKVRVRTSYLGPNHPPSFVQISSGILCGIYGSKWDYAVAWMINIRCIVHKFYAKVSFCPCVEIVTSV